jgi:hypothetical protein
MIDFVIYGNAISSGSELTAGAAIEEVTQGIPEI